MLTALAGNADARISVDCMARLVDASQRITSLRTPLTRHPRLTNDLAERLYLWVGEALRDALATRFTVDMGALDKAIATAVQESHGGHSEPAPAPAAPEERVGERVEMECRLIAKLHDAGQLRPSYLLRALREGRLSLFEAALAKLGGFDVEQVRLAVRSDTPELLAMACSAVGVDRSVFPTILSLVRDLNAGLPGGPDELAGRALGAHPPAAAATAFRQAVGAV